MSESAFEIAEIAHLKPSQVESYEKSLLDYWEVKNVKETAINDTMKKVAISLKIKNMPIEFIMEIMGLTAKEIEAL